MGTSPRNPSRAPDQEAPTFIPPVVAEQATFNLGPCMMRRMQNYWMKLRDCVSIMRMACKFFGLFPRSASIGLMDIVPVRHSTGRGGLANMTALHSPPPEGVLHHDVTYEVMGRGGAGNIIRSRSASRDPESRTRSPSGDRHGIAKLWNKMSRSHSRDIDSDSVVRGRPTTVPEHSVTTSATTTINE